MASWMLPHVVDGKIKLPWAEYVILREGMICCSWMIILILQGCAICSTCYCLLHFEPLNVQPKIQLVYVISCKSSSSARWKIDQRLALLIARAPNWIVKNHAVFSFITHSQFCRLQVHKRLELSYLGLHFPIMFS